MVKCVASEISCVSTLTLYKKLTIQWGERSTEHILTIGTLYIRIDVLLFRTVSDGKMEYGIYIYI